MQVLPRRAHLVEQRMPATVTTTAAETATALAARSANLQIRLESFCSSWMRSSTSAAWLASPSDRVFILPAARHTLQSATALRCEEESATSAALEATGGSSRALNQDGRHQARVRRMRREAC